MLKPAISCHTTLVYKNMKTNRHELVRDEQVGTAVILKSNLHSKDKEGCVTLMYDKWLNSCGSL